MEEKACGEKRAEIRKKKIKEGLEDEKKKE
jgi:hypothetical protein